MNLHNNPYVPTPGRLVSAILDAGLLKSGESHIDLGCGDGRICIAAADRGARSIGVDLDLGRCLPDARIVFVQADGLTFDWSDVDLITTGDIADENRPLVVQAFHRRAKDGARLIVGHPELCNLGMGVYYKVVK